MARAESEGSDSILGVEYLNFSTASAIFILTSHIKESILNPAAMRYELVIFSRGSCVVQIQLFRGELGESNGLVSTLRFV